MRALALLCLTLLPLPALAETLSAEIGHSGLAAVETRLAALPNPTDAEAFALGGVEFLRAIEGSFQERWAIGLTDRTGMLPLLRLPLQDNPNPAPFDPAAITTLFTHAAAKLTTAQSHLAAIPGTSDFSVEIALDDLWFDVDSSGSRSAGEGLADILGMAILGGAPDATAAPQPLPIVRFDVADAAWLAAYADLLAGLSDIFRAYDPTEPIARILTTRAKMQELGPITSDPFLGGGTSGLDAIDLVAMILATLDQSPDKALMAQAQAHLLSMIGENRQFWSRVASETDDDHEWLPNDHQHSALGIEVPQGTGGTWMAVLGDLEAVLNGTKLVPYWRVGAPAGINVAKMFSDPKAIDLAGWIQGWDALPYLEKGNVVSWDSLNALDRLTSGQAMLFALYLN